MEICPKVIAANCRVAINVAESCSRVISDIYFRRHSLQVTLCLRAIESQRVEF